LVDAYNIIFTKKLFQITTQQPKVCNPETPLCVIDMECPHQLATYHDSLKNKLEYLGIPVDSARLA